MLAAALTLVNEPPISTRLTSGASASVCTRPSGTGALNEATLAPFDAFSAATRSRLAPAIWPKSPPTYTVVLVAWTAQTAALALGANVVTSAPPGRL